MIRSQEFHAASVEEALEKASLTLGVPSTELDFTVLDRGSTGFLGIGSRDARISVELSGSQDLPSAEARETVHDMSNDLDEVTTPPSTSTYDAAEGVEEESAEKAPADTAPYELVVAVDEFMTSLVNAMGFDATVDVYDSGEVITVDVAVKETGLFIGQKGETIDAIQYLLNVGVYKERPFFKRIVVDAEGYRQRRVEAIQGMAHRTARRVMREKRPLSLPPMPPAERRVVHLFLKENPQVSTSSEGKDEQRKVVVSPI